MTYGWNSGLVSIASLLVSVFALGAVAIQTTLQWSTQDLPMRANLQPMQLDACTDIIERAIRFTNNNAEIRLIGAQLDDTRTDRILFSTKSNLQVVPKTKEEFDRALVERAEKIMKLADELHIVLLSKAHLFAPSVRMILANLLHMIAPLLQEPDGTVDVKPQTFNEAIEGFRAACKTVSSPLVETN